MRINNHLAGIVMAGATLALTSVGPSLAKDVKSVGISVGSLGNPGFVIIANTATRLIHKAYPQARVTTVGYDYDLGKQVNEIDNFIAAGVDFILAQSRRSEGHHARQQEGAGGRHSGCGVADTAAEGVLTPPLLRPITPWPEACS